MRPGGGASRLDSSTAADACWGHAAETVVGPECWDIRDIQYQLRIGRTLAWQLVKGDGFPTPVILGKRRLCWIASEVRGYLRTKKETGLDQAVGSASEAARPGGYRARERRGRRAEP